MRRPESNRQPPTAPRRPLFSQLLIHGQAMAFEIDGFQLPRKGAAFRTEWQRFCDSESCHLLGRYVEE
jgi:hypothetical protein